MSTLELIKKHDYILKHSYIGGGVVHKDRIKNCIYINEFYKDINVFYNSLIKFVLSQFLDITELTSDVNCIWVGCGLNGINISNEIFNKWLICFETNFILDLDKLVYKHDELYEVWTLIGENYHRAIDSLVIKNISEIIGDRTIIGV